MLGDQARLEQLETVEGAEDLIPAPRPDRLAGLSYTAFAWAMADLSGKNSDASNRMTRRRKRRFSTAARRSPGTSASTFSAAIRSGSKLSLPPSY